MLRECLKLKQVILAVLSAEVKTIEVDWESVEDVQDFLDVPAKVSTQIGASQTCSLTLALAANKLLIDHCNDNVEHTNPVIAAASSSMLQNLIAHARDLTCVIASVAKFLDLRVSRDTTSDDYAGDKAVVEVLLNSLASNEANAEQALVPNEGDDDDIDLFGTKHVATKAQSELQMFALNPQLSRDVNILEWWKAYRLEYPKLYRLAMDYLGCPATSVPSERANSAAKRLFEGRARLGDHMFKAEICVESWLRFAEKAKIDLPTDYLVALNDLAIREDLTEMAKDDAVVQLFLDLDS
ncbi:hypothetical protein AeMF1_018120 [Aphanomyces euteiches]|nr:hypothetical protein AeMF1_018120 [Aphanomyces euteiches]